MKRLVWIVPGREFLDLHTQWRSNRDYHRALRLATHKTDFIASEIDVLPGQPRKIAKSLACVESERDQTSPLIICDFKNTPNLWNRKAAPTTAVARFYHLHPGRWILIGVFAVLFRGLEHHPQKFDGVIDAAWRDALQFLCAKIENILPVNQCNLLIGTGTNPVYESSRFFMVETMRTWRDFRFLARDPRIEVFSHCRENKVLAGNISIQFRNHLLGLPGSHPTAG